MIKKRVDADQYPQEGISMLHILICDDEPEFASLLKAKITGLPHLLTAANEYRMRYGPTEHHGANGARYGPDFPRH